MKQITLLVFALYVSSVGARAQCASWKPGFNRPGLDGSPYAMLVHDDGSGPALFVGGGFSNAGGLPAHRIAKWNGASWSALANGVDGLVFALATYDDGTGSALYAGGAFANASGVGASNVARWNGTNWSALGTGTDDRVLALATFDDGTGLALYAGGYFVNAGGAGASHVAKWNGTSWTPLGAGVNGIVDALCVHDDGTGPALYVGGTFTIAGGGGGFTNNIARWNGSSWSAVGGGVGSAGFGVRDLVVHDDGTGGGAQLYACGSYSWPNVFRWNGTTWSSVGMGFDSPEEPIDLCVHDDGSGPALYGAGVTLKRWIGSAWITVGAGDGYVSAIESYGGALYAGGDFTNLYGVSLSHVGRLSASTWSAVGPGDGIADYTYPSAPPATVDALVTHTDVSATNSALYVGGTFPGAGNVQAAHVARWNGTSWSALSSGMSGGSYPSTAVYALGSVQAGPLYAGGSFTSAGGVSASNIAEWNGVAWSALGAGVGGGPVNALVEHDDGSGTSLFVAGGFDSAGGAPASRIAKWSGAGWSTLSSGPSSGAINALAVFDDGSGAALYAGGSFTQLQGVSADRVARWDGIVWTPLGVVGTSDDVLALAAFDDGSGSALYAGGRFTMAGGAGANHVAKWNGTSWSPVGGGLSSNVTALAVHDDGSGPALYAAVSPGTVSSASVARWDGVAWSTIGILQGSPFTAANALLSHDDHSGGGPSLYVGGNFVIAGDVPSNDIAQWRGCAPGVPYCFGDAAGNLCPCTNFSALAAREGCLNSFALGGRLRASGVASLANDTIALLGAQMTNSTCLYIQGTTQTGGGIGATFGDGLRCVSGTVVRLATKTNVGGASMYPAPGDMPLSIRGAIAAPGVRNYQVWYRNAAAFCTSATFNLTNGMQIAWTP